MNCGQLYTAWMNLVVKSNIVKSYWADILKHDLNALVWLSCGEDNVATPILFFAGVFGSTLYYESNYAFLRHLISHYDVIGLYDGKTFREVTKTEAETAGVRFSYRLPKFGTYRTITDLEKDLND